MTDARFDALCIGNAIVDVLSRTDDGFLAREGLAKGSMRLIDEAEAERLYEAMGPAIEISGGSAGNTAAGIASLGARAAFIGKVAGDGLGRIFRHDITSAGVTFPTDNLGEGPATARSMILITPDGERTMNTFLGACQELTPKDIDADVVSGAAITYLEGYLWDPPKAKEAFRRAADLAHRAGRKVALTLSDSFCVDRYRDEFLGLLRNGEVDILFANQSELKSLYQTADFATAVAAARGDAELAAVTMSEKGSLIMTRAETHQVRAAPVESIVDLTGAGDLYASGVLSGLARGRPLAECARLGSLCAAEVIGHIGARPEVSLADLAAQAGIDWNKG
jgi:sugar/nucleoside kinase (ribokinase family)